MSPFRRRIAVAGVAALTLGLGVAGSTTAVAVPTAPPAYAPSWLALETSRSSSTVSLLSTGEEAPVSQQSLMPDKGCELKTSPTLLAFTGSPALRRGAGASTGLANGGIGVRESATASGTSCSAVDAPTESLMLKLGPDVGGLLAASASLDLDLKGNAVIRALATRGTGPATVFELRSGNAINPAQPTGTPTNPAIPTQGYIFNCLNNGSADSGSDNTTNNNCRWEISSPSWTSLTEDGVVFDTLVLTPMAGSFSLMGGADGVVQGQVGATPSYLGSPGASYFELVEGTVDCSEGTNTANLRSSATVPKSTWKRLGNLTDEGTNTEACTAYPYSGTTGVNQLGQPYAQFNKPLDFEPNAQALWETTFTYSGNVADPIPGTKPGLPKVYMDLDGDDAGEFELVWCDPSWTVSGVFEGPPDLSAVTNPFACLVSAVAGPKVGSSKSGVYTAYVYGDAVMRR